MQPFDDVPAQLSRSATGAYMCSCVSCCGAGLEEYAAPIIDAIDPTKSLISDRLYRPACMRTQHHQCIKDLALLGRPLSRWVHGCCLFTYGLVCYVWPLCVQVSLFCSSCLVYTVSVWLPLVCMTSIPRV